MSELVNLRTRMPETTTEKVLSHLEHAMLMLDEASPHSAIGARLQEVIDFIIRDQLQVPVRTG